MAKFQDAQGKTFKLTEFLSYNDIVMRPQYSEIESRNDPCIETKFQDISLGCPILSAPMDCVTESNLAMELALNGGLPVFHRFYPATSKEILDYRSYKLNDHPLIISVGLMNDLQKQRLANLYLNGVNPDGYCIDIAHGENKSIIETVNYLKRINKPIIAGSVATYEGAAFLCNLGVDAIRVGIGGGSACSTRIITGMGVPNVNAILECRKAIEEWKPDTLLIADGGISTPGDYAKAIALGTDVVMLGKVLAATKESAAKYAYELINDIKIYRGQSSKDFQIDHGLYRPSISPEGESFPIKVNGTVKEILDYFNGGLRSSMSYCGARTIKEFQEKAIFHIVSHNAYIEGTPHGKK